MAYQQDFSQRQGGYGGGGGYDQSQGYEQHGGYEQQSGYEQQGGYDQQGGYGGGNDQYGNEHHQDGYGDNQQGGGYGNEPHHQGGMETHQGGFGNEEPHHGGSVHGSGFGGDEREKRGGEGRDRDERGGERGEDHRNGERGGPEGREGGRGGEDENSELHEGSSEQWEEIAEIVVRRTRAKDPEDVFSVTMIVLSKCSVRDEKVSRRFRMLSEAAEAGGDESCKRLARTKEEAEQMLEREVVPEVKQFIEKDEEKRLLEMLLEDAERDAVRYWKVDPKGMFLSLDASLWSVLTLCE